MTAKGFVDTAELGFNALNSRPIIVEGHVDRTPRQRLQNSRQRRRFDISPDDDPVAYADFPDTWTAGRTGATSKPKESISGTKKQ
jgi:hypothetical protein